MHGIKTAIIAFSFLSLGPTKLFAEFVPTSTLSTLSSIWTLTSAVLVDGAKQEDVDEIRNSIKILEETIATFLEIEQGSNLTAVLEAQLDAAALRNYRRVLVGAQFRLDQCISDGCNKSEIDDVSKTLLKVVSEISGERLSLQAIGLLGLAKSINTLIGTQYTVVQTERNLDAINQIVGGWLNSSAFARWERQAQDAEARIVNDFIGNGAIVVPENLRSEGAINSFLFNEHAEELLARFHASVSSTPLTKPIPKKGRSYIHLDPDIFGFRAVFATFSCYLTDQRFWSSDVYRLPEHYSILNDDEKIWYDQNVYTDTEFGFLIDNSLVTFLNEEISFSKQFGGDGKATHKEHSTNSFKWDTGNVQGFVFENTKSAYLAVDPLRNCKRVRAGLWRTEFELGPIDDAVAAYDNQLSLAVQKLAFHRAAIQMFLEIAQDSLG